MIEMSSKVLIIIIIVIVVSLPADLQTMSNTSDRPRSLMSANVDVDVIKRIKRIRH
jgi:hypothetical protein